MEDKQTEVLCAMALERAAAAYTTGCTPFLTPAERLAVHQYLCEHHMAERCFYWGGCRDSERCSAVFIPEWRMTEEIPPVQPGYAGAFDRAREAWLADALCMDPTLADEIPIRALQICGSGFAALAHRDFLGAILAAGVERDAVGEIAVLSEKEAILYVRETMVSFLMENLHRIGRDAVRVTQVRADPQFSIPRRFAQVHATAASPRLDGVVHALTDLSRERASALVRDGMVTVNYVLCEKPDRQVMNGDVLTIRGYGKFLVDSVTEETRRGRKRLSLRKYI